MEKALLHLALSLIVRVINQLSIIYSSTAIIKCIKSLMSLVSIVPPPPVITSISNVTESVTTDSVTVSWSLDYNVVNNGSILYAMQYIDSLVVLDTCNYNLVSSRISAHHPHITYST